MLSVAVFNHFQRLRHDDNMAARRKEREEAARVDAAEVGSEPEGGQSSTQYQDQVPYPPTGDARKLMSDRSRFTRSLFEEENRLGTYQMSIPRSFSSKSRYKKGCPERSALMQLQSIAMTSAVLFPFSCLAWA